MNFVNEARSYIRELIPLDKSQFNLPIIEANTAPLALYYLQKAFKYEYESRNIKVKKRSLVWKLAWCLKEITLSIKNYFSFSNNHGSCDYLFVCNVERQQDVIGPIVDQLLNKRDVSIVIVTKVPLPISKKIQNSNVIYTDWSQLRGFSYISELFSTLLELKQPVLPPSEATNGFYQWFETNIFGAVRAILLGKIVSKKYKPKIIVVTDPSDYEAKSFTQMGKNLGIPSLCIQYGSLAPDDTEWEFFSQDAVAVFDSTSMKILNGFGITPKKIHITGNPRFDYYISDAIQRDKTRKELRVKKHTPLILFSSIPSAPDGIGVVESSINQKAYIDILKAIYQLPNILTNYQFVVRPHPEEDISLHNPYLKDNSEKIIYDNKNSIFNILNAADLVITMHSTVGYEAIVLDKPLIVINVKEGISQVDYARRGAAVAIDEVSELAVTIESFLEDPILQEKLTLGRIRYRDETGVIKHDSANRCVQLMDQLMNNEN